MSAGRKSAVVFVLLLALVGSASQMGSAAAIHAGSTSRTAWQTATTITPTNSAWSYTRLTSPMRVVVSDSRGAVATFTVGARSVRLRGPQRVFSESTTAATVTTRVWVRLLAHPFSGTVDTAWLASALADRSPDVLALATQYLTGAPDLTASTGLRRAGDASYGPLLADGTRQEGSDFNDYLGLPWSYGSSLDKPERDQFGALDCSGYVRIVFGYRSGVRLTLLPNGSRLPRRAVQMLDSAPGHVVISDAGSRPTNLSGLQPGDLVFFDASTSDGSVVDHVGILLGLDSTGALRFVSSRKSADGPTMGDTAGRSTITGTGYYATAFRAARRV